MPKKSLRASMNQIRTWVRQGRTDAWIAHQLDVPTTQLRDFKRQHGLEAGGEEEPSDVELRDEIEAEVEAASAAEPEEPEDEEPEEEPRDEPDTAEKEPETAEKPQTAEKESEAAEKKPEAAGKEPEKREGGDGRPRRRRRRRRGRGGRRALEAVFDHGERDGYGLWLDPAVKDDPVYAEHWSGKRELKVSIEPDRIVLERVEGGGGKNGGKGD